MVTTRSARHNQIRTEIASLWRLAWPILIGQLANVGMSVVDVAMAGHASAQDLAVMALFKQQIAAAYTSDLAVASAVAQLLFLAALFQLSDATQVAASCTIRGYKVTRAPMLIHLTAFWVISLPLGYALGLAPQWLPWAPSQPLGAQGFSIALVVGLTVAALGLTVLLQHVTRERAQDEIRHKNASPVAAA